MTAHKMETFMGLTRFVESIMPVVSKRTFFFFGGGSLREVAKNVSYLRHVYRPLLSVRPSTTGRISVKFDPGDFFMKTCRENPNLVEIG